MKVSILVHNLNRAGDLRRCLASVVSQEYRPIEVVLLDAGSTDGSLDVIAEYIDKARSDRIEFNTISCHLSGVAASRNLAARHATGDLLVFLDNDACFASGNAIDEVVRCFLQESDLALIAFQIRLRDTLDLDPGAWVFRRSLKKWASTPFQTFTFAGGGCCIRADLFFRLQGFWTPLIYSREEEELALGIIHEGLKILYAPKIAICHFPNPKGRSSIAERRQTELRNGILVFWRRFPRLIALAAIGARIAKMCTRAIVAREGNPFRLLLAVANAISDWRNLELAPNRISYRTLLRYTSLHFTPAANERTT